MYNGLGFGFGILNISERINEYSTFELSLSQNIMRYKLNTPLHFLPTPPHIPILEKAPEKFGSSWSVSRLWNSTVEFKRQYMIDFYDVGGDISLHSGRE